jgi:hypothetical protein
MRARKADNIARVTNTARKGKRATPGAPSMVELIVRRGALRRYDKLKHATAELPVKLSWDRRLRERRAPGGGAANERRQADRRKKPPFTWSTADFVVVESPAPARSRPKPKAKRR